MHLTTYLDVLRGAEQALAHSYRTVSAGHAADADVHYATTRFAAQCDAHAEALVPLAVTAPAHLHAQRMDEHRDGPVGLLRDLQDLYQLANLVDITWTLVGQAAHGARDRDLIRLASDCGARTAAQLAWLRMRMKSAAPQTLLAAP